MAKDVDRESRLDDLTNAEIERIEGLAFCLGGPPEALTPRLLWRASLSTAAKKDRPCYS